MKKKVCLGVAVSLLSAAAAFAQGEMDAYKFSRSDLSGTARYLSMGGAFGALGGDISVMGANPAGLSIYRSSEIVTSISVSSVKTDTDWSGTEMDDSKTKFNFDNIAYVGYFPTGNDEGLVGWNVGFSYNRVMNFNRRYKMGRGAGGFSLSDYIAAISNREEAIGNDLLRPRDDNKSYDSYDRYIDQNWLSVVGYNSGMISSSDPSQPGGFFSSFGDEEYMWDVQSADLRVHETGGVDKYNFSIATNISNTVFIGATMAVTDLNYHLTSIYDENFGRAEGALSDDLLYLGNYSSVDGTGYAFNLGMIVRPCDALRLGIAYNSPTWYKVTDYHTAEAGAEIYGYNDPEGRFEKGKGEEITPPDAYTEYRLRTSDRWIFSAATIIGQTVLFSVDYELSRYKAMHLSGWDGYEWTGEGLPDNVYIKEDFGIGSMVKAGAEIKVTPQFAVRLGGAWQNSPVKSHLLYDEEKGIESLGEVSTANTRTAYTVSRNTGYATFGLGYRFTPNFYADVACVYRIQKEDAYPFSNVFDETTGKPVESVPAALKLKTTKVALTLGYKF